MGRRRRAVQVTLAVIRSVFGAIFNRIRAPDVPLINCEDVWIVSRRRLGIQGLRHKP